MGEVVLARDTGVVVGVVEAQQVQLDELEQLVEPREVPEQAGAVAEEVAHAVEHLFDGADGAGLVPLVQLAPDEVGVGVERPFQRDEVGQAGASWKGAVRVSGGG
jgi:hypothetical protein